MRLVLAAALLAVLAPVPALAQARLSPADEAAAFRAAGFTRVGKAWKHCREGSDTASYVPGSVDVMRDINGDGLPDAVLIEQSAICHGMAGQRFWLVSKQPGGAWRLITGAVGIPTFLPRPAARGWPDIEIGGPGFCFPVHRWNGRAYALHRSQYEGKPCRRP